jgi:hypothetical protein
MIEFTIKKGVRNTRVKIWTSIEDLPIERFTKANKYWMLDDAIGSDISSFDKNHYSKFKLISGDKVKILKELENFRILVYNIMNEVNVEHLSFAVLVHSINGVETNDISEDALKTVLKRLSDAGMTQETLKKKLKLGTRSTKN